MKYTDNYHFDLYEPDDNANLMDGYNHSMQMVRSDEALYTRDKD